MKAGFAKLQGEDFEYFMQSYSITLGRNSKKASVDLDLTDKGGGMNISRQHARIFYHFQHKCFELEVLGKNGAYVEGVLHLPSTPPVKLGSQYQIVIGDKKFYFLLPVKKHAPGSWTSELAAPTGDGAGMAAVPHSKRRSTLPTGATPNMEGRTAGVEGRGVVVDGRGVVGDGRGVITEGSRAVTDGRGGVADGRGVIQEGRGMVPEGRGVISDGRVGGITEGRAVLGEMRTPGVVNDSKGVIASGKRSKMERVRDDRYYPAGMVGGSGRIGGTLGKEATLDEVNGGRGDITGPLDMWPQGEGKNTGGREMHDDDGDEEDIEVQLLNAVSQLLSELHPPGEWVSVTRLSAELEERFRDICQDARTINLLPPDDSHLRNGAGFENGGGLDGTGRRSWVGLSLLLKRHPKSFVFTYKIKNRVKMEYVALT
ncbi:hypothetical protein CBR_g31665 [Chara braunii]|uniref:FHA domain-containing protein n=1 Tax=Chara braunii TaxID=69332 RepID=A0A388JXX4_CHABU|nr:hypothetical protein CBR_g31665 [Chara braunii]|eukprot:GBG62646.1 hypothetical protein CBR_g31665 [Chara braunii]